MDTNSTIIIVAIVFALVIIIGFIIFRRKAKVDLELPGSKLKFDGSNEAKPGEIRSKTPANGIFGNLSLGRTRMKVKGSGTISDNKSIGDTELTKEDIPSISKKKNK
jgi:hypothetical protein